MEVYMKNKLLGAIAFVAVIGFSMAACSSNDNGTPTDTKTVSVGTQSGTLTAGTAGNVTYAVTTAHIADGTYPATVANLPGGVTVGNSGNVTIARNSGTLTLSGDTSTTKGTLNTLTLTLDGTTSAAFSITRAKDPANSVYANLEAELAKRKIPDVLDKDGKWTEARKAEVLEIISTIYGKRPADPESYTYAVKETSPISNGATYTLLQISCHLSAADYPGVTTFPEADGKFVFDVACYTPQGMSEANKKPALVYIAGRPNLGNSDRDTFMARKDIAMFVIGYWYIVNDYNDGAENNDERRARNAAGIDRMYYGDYRLAFEGSKQEITNIPRPADMPAGVASTRGPYDPGNMQFWSWGASRVMDYLHTRNDVDLKKVAVHGFSRAGTTALLTAAFDDRFTLVCPPGGNSALLRGNLKGGNPFPHHVNTLYIQWYCRNLLAIGSSPPSNFDSHFLFACVAPRKVYATSHMNDTYVDPYSEYLALYAASEVWGFYPDTKGFICEDRAPQFGDKFEEGDIGYAPGNSGHTFNQTDWKNFFDFLVNME
jgi:hypothetical protein